MIPTRNRLNGWKFGPILTAADSVRSRGAAIESAASGIHDRCRSLPELNVWDGTAHRAAEDAFGRAKTAASAVGDIADSLAAVMTQGYWDLDAAKTKLMRMVEDIERQPFLVHDQWAITLKPAEMTAKQVRKLMERRDELQSELNPLVCAMGDTDDSVAAKVNNAAKAHGFVVPKASPFTPWKNPPNDDVPDPRMPLGLMHQRSISDADASMTTREVQHGKNSEGQPTQTLIMQDGSKVVKTDTSTYGRPSNKEEHFAPDGTLKWYTQTMMWGDSGKTSVWTQYLDSDIIVHTLINPNGVPDTTVHVPGKPDVRLGARLFNSDTMSQFSGVLRHPATGAVLSGVETLADNSKLQAASKSMTPAHWDNLKAGAKYGGLGLSTGFALYDLAVAEPEDKCEAAITGAFSVVGGYAGGVLGSAGGNPVTAVIGAYGGTWLFTNIGEKVGEWACN